MGEKEWKEEDQGQGGRDQEGVIEGRRTGNRWVRGREQGRGQERQRPAEKEKQSMPSPKYLIPGQVQIGECGSWKGCRAPWRLTGPNRDPGLPSDFQGLSTPPLPAGPGTATGQAKRLTPRDLPLLWLWQGHGPREPPPQPWPLCLQPGPSAPAPTPSRYEAQ